MENNLFHAPLTAITAMIAGFLDLFWYARDILRLNSKKKRKKQIKQMRNRRIESAPAAPKWQQRTPADYFQPAGGLTLFVDFDGDDFEAWFEVNFSFHFFSFIQQKKREAWVR